MVNVLNFNGCNVCITLEFFSQEFSYQKLRKSVSKFCHRYKSLVWKFLYAKRAFYLHNIHQ